MLSIIIINYKSEVSLFKCLHSLKEKACGIEYEIIVFNNDSQKITLPENMPPVKIIGNGNNVGFGNACNLAFKESSGNALFFLNPDTELLSGKLADAVALLDDEKIGMISPEILSANDSIEKWSFGTEITPVKIILNNLIKIGLPASSLKYPDWASGAAMIIRRDVFEKIGGFDRRFFMYFEDVDLCKRIRAAGFKIRRFPLLKIRHFGGRSFTDKRLQKKMYYASQDLYISKHFGKRTSYFLKLLRFFHK